MATIEQVANNYYTLTIEGLDVSSSSLSVLSLHGQELLNEPWRYEITFTCADKQLLVMST